MDNPTQVFHRNFFSTPREWKLRDNKLVRTVSVSDPEKFINDVSTLSGIFQHDPHLIKPVPGSPTEVYIELQTHDPVEVTSRDYGLASSIDLVARNQEELRDIAGETRKKLIYAMGRTAITASLVRRLINRGFSNEAKLLQFAAENLGSPNVEVAPQLRGEISEAIERIKHDVDPRYFNNVSRIDILLGGPYGQVSSDDPTTIKINLPKIREEVKKQLAERLGQENIRFDSTDQQHQKIFDEVLMRGIIEVVSHEKGHVEDFEPKIGEQGEFLGGTFPGGEGPAEAEADRVKNIIEDKNPLPL